MVHGPGWFIIDPGSTLHILTFILQNGMSISNITMLVGLDPCT